MLYQTLKLIKLWKLLQVVDSLQKQFGDIKLSKCRDYVEEEGDEILNIINKVLPKSELIKEETIEYLKEEDIVTKLIDKMLNKKFRRKK